jgi:phospholipid/cholesterol/gamma-HCH transport system ATP-binding protein
MISIQNIYKSFNGLSVLKDASLEIKKGETLVIIGGSGCGKSVMLKSILGVLSVDKGKIWIKGKDITVMDKEELLEMRKNFGMLFQGAALFDSLNVRENVGFALYRHTNLSEKEIRKIIKEKLSIVNLEFEEEKMPSELSGGMKKRAALARAIAMEPEVILYDEPTTGLDPIMADNINNLIIDLKRKLSITSIAVTHDMQSAYKIADRIAMLYDGRIIEMGTPEEIKNTKNPIVRRFIRGEAKKIDD